MRAAALLALLLAACGPVAEAAPTPADVAADAPAGDGEAEAAPSKPMPTIPSDGQTCAGDTDCGARQRCDLDAGVCRWR